MGASRVMVNRKEKSVWWGSFEFDEDHVGRWRVGPSTLWIYRSAQSWHLIQVESDDSLDDSAWIDTPKPIEQTDLSMDQLPDEAVVSRYSFQKTDAVCSLQAVLADRAIVVRPDIPLYVLAGEEVTLYVSTPLWIRVEVGSEARLLQELPSFRPSDTWFGPSTREGELCYSVKTAGRLRLENLPKRLHRAITPIHVRNHGSDALHIERVQVPVQYLSLFEGPDHFLWTQSVKLDRETAGHRATVRFDETGIPKEAGATTQLRGPRLHVRTNTIVRTLSSLFHRPSLDS